MAIPISIRAWVTRSRCWSRQQHAQSLCGKINPAKASATAPGHGDGDGDTIVLATADRWGNMVSWVNSNFSGFGSGVTVPGYGFFLHNRGGLFTPGSQEPQCHRPAQAAVQYPGRRLPDAGHGRLTAS